jgi:CubicO group peptidase (beta-lactamase class C family)
MALAVLLVPQAASAASSGKEQDNAQVDKVFADLQKPGSPGCALGVFRDGQILYAKGYGLASVEVNAPITPQTVFDIGSTSKQFTASSIVLLEQQGKLSVNDDVHKYIPELPDYGHKITILNLLNHTSGLRDYLALLPLSGVNEDSVTTDDDALALIIRQKHLNFAPGSQWAYSNTGYFLLSVIVKRVSGMTLREFASRNIFQPLGMTHTVVRNDHTLLIPYRALAYDPGENGGYKLNVSYFEQTGDGAVHTSVEDLAKWDENFYSDQVGGKSFIDEMQERGKLNNGKVLDYAKGLFIGQYRGLPTVSHEGAWGGYRAELMRFPRQHFSVACLCNLGNINPDKRARKVAEVYLGNLMKPDEIAKPQAAISLTPAQMAALTGLYIDPATGSAARILVAGGKVQLQIYGSTFELRAVSSTQFLVAGVDAKIDFVLGNGAAHVSMTTGGLNLPAVTYQKSVQYEPSASAQAAYAGDFKSYELGAVYRLRVVAGKLMLVEISDPSGIPRTGMPMPKMLQPTITDQFEIGDEGIAMQFLKNANSDVTGFDLGGLGIRGIEFLRTTTMDNIPTTF